MSQASSEEAARRLVEGYARGVEPSTSQAPPEETTRLLAGGYSESQQGPWAILNSPFVLWVLSSLALGLITWLYSLWQTNHAHKLENEKTITKLDIEISETIFSYERLINLTKANRTSLAENAQRPGYLSGGFPEYKGRSLRSLIWELEDLVPQDEKGDLKNALTASEQIDKLLSQHWNDPVSPAVISILIQVESYINNSLKLLRWNM